MPAPTPLVPTYTVAIYIGGDLTTARRVCAAFVLEHPICVTVEPIDFIYPGCSEAGVRVGLINYARFPADPATLWDAAVDLARFLRTTLSQHSFSIVAAGGDKTLFETVREQ